MNMYVESIPWSNRILREHMAGGGRLLDIGGSDNPDRVGHLTDLFSEVVMADLKPPKRPLPAGIRFVECAIERLEPQDGLYDHILLSNVLEHLEHPGAALRRAAALLAENGRIHILSPNCESLNRRIGLLMGVLNTIRDISEAEVKMGHRHALSVADVAAMIRGAGLELRERRGVFLKPVPTPEMIAWPADRRAAFFQIAPDLPPELCHEVYFMAVRAGKSDR